ncbi:MAG: hypothetical protein ABW026_01610 [Microvirga sp.]
MTKIVRKPHPVARLPDDPQVPPGPSRTAAPAIEQDDDSARQAPDPAFMRVFGAAKACDTSIADAVERIRTLRDEWDDAADRIRSLDRQP